MVTSAQIELKLRYVSVKPIQHSVKLIRSLELWHYDKFHHTHILV